MNKISFRKKQKISLLLSVVLSVTAIVSLFGLLKKPIFAHAATNGLFTARMASIDLEDTSYPVTSTPAITVLTHGLGGYASNWSNVNGNFAYDNRSLIEKLRQESGGQVFLAQMNTSTSFYLRSIPVQEQLTTYVPNSKTITELTLNEINQHMIIVFEATLDSVGHTGSNSQAYNQFKRMLTDIAHDFGYVTDGTFPRINLIGHSRGGLTNMDFANEFPRLVDSMFALGTPFLGSNFGRINLFADMFAGYDNAGLTSINKASEQKRLKNAWNVNQLNGKGSHIKFYTMSGTSTLGMIADVGFGGVWGQIVSSILTAATAAGGLLSYPAIVTIAATIIWGIEATKSYPQTRWDTINDAFYDAISGWAFLWLGRTTEVNDDLLVHKDSQDAKGYNGIIDKFTKRFNTGVFGTDYNFDQNRTSAPNFAIAHNLETRDEDFIDWIMSKININFSIFSTAPIVGTNNCEIIGLSISKVGVLTIPEYINGRLVTAIGAGAFANQSGITSVTISDNITNIGSNAFHANTSIYKGSFKIGLIGLKDLSILGVNPNITLPSNLTIPTFIGNRTVRQIGNSAFANQTELTSISLPNTLESIGQRAFDGCTGLSSLYIPYGVKVIGDDAFKNCSNLNIYVERTIRPSTWSSSWNSSNCPVTWGYLNATSYNDLIELDCYDFPSFYNNFTPIPQDIVSVAGQDIETNRLRCGVINYDGKSYLTLSAKNKDATQAYLEYYFTDCLLEFDYQLGLWSSSESLILNSSIRLEALYDNQWTPVRIFNASSMAQDKDNLFSYSTILDEPTKAIRFIVDTNQVSNDNNKGRVVIGNIDAVFYEYEHEHDFIFQPAGPTGHIYHCNECDYFGMSSHSYVKGDYDEWVCILCGYVSHSNNGIFSWEDEINKDPIMNEKQTY